VSTSSNRITRRHVESVFDSFLNSVGGRKAESYKDVGGYTLDYAAVYGGYQVERISNEGGGVSLPFGHGRRSTKEMYDVMAFAIRVLDDIKYRQQEA
jgi:hypothetical protein